MLKTDTIYIWVSLLKSGKRLKKSWFYCRQLYPTCLDMLASFAHKTLGNCWFNAGPMADALARNWTNVEPYTGIHVQGKSPAASLHASVPLRPVCCYATHVAMSDWDLFLTQISIFKPLKPHICSFHWKIIQFDMTPFILAYKLT